MIARVPCRVIATQSEQLDTTVYTRPDAEGIATIVRIVFRGRRRYTSSRASANRDLIETSVPRASSDADVVPLHAHTACAFCRASMRHFSQ